eukprot:g623.t1
MDFLAKAMQVVAPELAATDAEENITIIGSFKRVLEIIGFRANVLASQGQTAAALEDVMLLNRLVTQSRRTYQSSLSKYYLIQQVVPVYELGIRLNRQLYEQTGEGRYLEQAYALNARNKAILLLESLQSDRAMTFAGLPPALQEEEKTLRDALIEQERLLYLAYQNDQEIDSLQAVVFDHEQAYYRFVQQLEKDYPAYYDLKYSADQPPAVSAVQNQLEGDQALLEYFMGQDSIYTFLMDGRDMTVFSKPKPAGFVDSVELFRELLTNGIEKDCETTYIRLGRYFYDLLLAAPLAQLEGSKNRLVIIPDGLLNFFSFEALLYKDVDRLRGADGFLIERYAFSYAYSSKLLLEQAYYPRSASKGFVGFGMEYDDHTLNYLHELDYGDWKYIDSTFTLPCGQLKDTTRYYGKLTYSDDEVRGIAELAQGDSWLNESVTKRNFLQHAGDYNLLHLAMHGTYDLDFPMNSSLIFTRTDSSDVFLRAAEIYGMELTGDMVVLSACNTAYGKLQPGEGPMTLARAFHYAGIPSVVASLWSIPDNSTSRIMKLFYEQLDKGLPKDQALQQAKLAYLASDDISSPNTRQPLHWAPTIVIGDINPVEAQAPIQYRLNLDNIQHHELDIEVTFPALPAKPLVVRMPTSSPGRYAEHNFAKNVYDLTATNAKGQALPVSRTGLNEWMVAGHDGSVVLTYTLYANRADGTYAKADNRKLHLNMPATFVYGLELNDRPVELIFPADQYPEWKVATQLEQLTARSFRAPNYYYFYDSPTFFGDIRFRSWKVGKQTIEMAFLSPDPDSLLDAYAEWTKQIVAEQEAVYGELPQFDFGRYTFLCAYNPYVSGDGMEHRNSTICSASVPLEGYSERLIGTVSHEFFHCWNVERIRPASLEPFDFDQANQSGELWFAEGFTSYYDDLSLARAGILSREDYVSGLSGMLNYVLLSAGTRHRGPIGMSQCAPFVDAASSIDPDNFANTFISYYSYGAVLGLALDLELRRDHRTNLNAYMQLIWERYGLTEVPYHIPDLRTLLAELTGDEAFAQQWFARHIYGSELPDVKVLLKDFGVSMEIDEPEQAGEALTPVGGERLGFSVHQAAAGVAESY